MIYGHGSDDVGKFSFVPKLPYVSPYLWLGLANLVHSRYLQLWTFMLLRVGAFIICQWS
jgi:hypothetical protein